MLLLLVWGAFCVAADDDKLEVEHADRTPAMMNCVHSTKSPANAAELAARAVSSALGFEGVPPDLDADNDDAVDGVC